ncbi:hypothetical protein KCP71_11640 [Salmonella enterica subsp. enterica]|nr:hypothetical protein KCP71_11640 [Salmonella enterica subsp. enterica]
MNWELMSRAYPRWRGEHFGMGTLQESSEFISPARGTLNIPPQTSRAWFIRWRGEHTDIIAYKTTFISTTFYQHNRNNLNY